MSMLQYPDDILDDKFFKEKVYHKGITVIATIGCEESHIKKTINCLTHIQSMFEKRRINISLGDIFKYVLLIGTEEAGEDFSSKISTTYGWDAVFVESKSLIAINNMFNNNVYKRNLFKFSIEGFDQSYSNMMYTLTHEIGHAVHMKFITKEAKSYYDGISNLFISLKNVSSSLEDYKKILEEEVRKELLVLIYEEVKKLIVGKDYTQTSNLEYEDLKGLLDKQEIARIDKNIESIVKSKDLEDFKKHIKNSSGSSEEHNFSNLFPMFTSEYVWEILNIMLQSEKENNITHLEEIMGYLGLYQKARKEFETSRKKKLYAHITELVDSAKGNFKNFFIDTLEELTELNFGDLYKASEDIVRELFVTKYSTENTLEDFAEHFAYFILNRNMMSDWNVNRIVNTLDMSRAFGKELMKAHKDVRVLKKYLKVVVENILKS